MAKRGRPRNNGLDKAAIGIGKALGHAMNRLDKWRADRDEIVADIRQVMAAGTKALAELGQDATRYVGSIRLRRAVIRRAGRKRGRRGGFKMSRAARAKISAAQKARWAARRKKAGRSTLD